MSVGGTKSDVVVLVVLNGKQAENILFDFYGIV